MSSAPIVKARHKTEAALYITLVSLTLAAGVFLRFYRLEAHKLWLDELYMLELLRMGPGALWQSAFVDFLAPLSSLPYWLMTQLYGLNALGLRLLSALSGVLVLPLFYLYSRRKLAAWPALAITAMLALAPQAVYYAQEGRFYALGLLGAVLLLWSFEYVHTRRSGWAWLVYALSAAVAAQFYYLNALLVIGQLLALLLLSPPRGWALRGVLLTGVMGLLLVGPFVFGPLSVLSGWSRYAPLSFLPALQTLFSGDLRIATPEMRLAALLVMAIGLAWAVQAAPTRRLEFGAWLAPVIVVLGFIFVALPLAGHPAPSYDERALLMLLPLCLLLFGLGLEQVGRVPGGRVAALALLAVYALASFSSLETYFTRFVKSPEGELALALAAQAQAGDCVLAAAESYSAAAAVQFYAPQVRLYYNQRSPDGQPLFETAFSLTYIAPPSPEVTFAELQPACTRIWLLQRRVTPPFFERLLSEHPLREQIERGPFRASLLER